MDKRDDRMKALLAILIVAGFFGVIAALFLAGELPESTKDVLLVAIGALIGAFKEVVSYFVGSSSGSAAKSATIERQLAQQPLGDTEPVAVKVDTSAAPVEAKETR